MSIAPGVAFTAFNTSLSSSARWMTVTKSEGGITGLGRGVYGFP